MGIKRALMYSLFSALMVVSFQNCGQTGSLSLQSQSDLGKIGSNPNGGDDGLSDISNVSDIAGDEGISDVQAPPVGADPISLPPNDGSAPGAGGGSPGAVPGSGGSIVDSGDDDDDDDRDIVDSDDDGNLSGSIASCAQYMNMDLSHIGNTNVVMFSNTRGPLKIENQERVVGTNHRGLLILNNITSIPALSNIRSLSMRINAETIGQLTNIRGVALVKANSFVALANFRGLGCIASSIDSTENFRGVLEVKGNLKSVKNFRGILKVDGDIESLENFRGILKVSGKISKRVNVRVRL